MQILKDAMIAACLAILAFLEPIQDDLMTLLILFVSNMLVGCLADKIVFTTRFSLVKAFRAIYEACLFFTLVLVVFLIATVKGLESAALTCVSFISYVVLYFYGINILRNLQILIAKNTPPYRVNSFLYYVLRLGFVDRIPMLRDYLNTEAEQ